VSSHCCVIVAEREGAPKGAASLCDHRQPLPLCPRLPSVSPRLSVSCSPDGVVTSILAGMCHLALPVKPWGVWVGVILPVL